MDLTPPPVTGKEQFDEWMNLLYRGLISPLILKAIKSGATQAAAGAVTSELWRTDGHATLPDGVIMIGV